MRWCSYLGDHEESTYDKLHAKYTRFYGWAGRGRDALEQDIAVLIKEGRSRAQAIREIAKRKGVGLSSVIESEKERGQPSPKVTWESQIKKIVEDSFNAVVVLLLIIVIELFILIYLFNSAFSVFRL
jgi:hypothetical protein